MKAEGWKEENNVLTKEFSFENFKLALDFVVRVGGVAEALQHHPGITLHSYNKVKIVTTTHDAGNIVADKDWKLAEAIDLLY